ncbi:hypothetical protein J2Y69_001471 [Microbacterium resistens]|uniref:HutD family protein n=1 Tax=Microbacterium resistens TaxID=156977 RepID=A0ABU1SDA1_9MICO|nr:hypothetical protein [Microbacterium resistens]MDR6866872.1 hypothetical protein [Microbacterium resistens]
MNPSGPIGGPHAPTDPATRLLHLRDLPRRSPVSGGGSIREIWASTGGQQEPRWLLQLVEVRGHIGRMSLPHHADHLLAGLSGPQVTVGSLPLAASLRKGRVLPYAGSSLELRRPALRAAEPSRVILLSAFDRRDPPRLVFLELQGTSALPTGTRAVVVRAGRLRIGGVTASAFDAVGCTRSPVIVSEAEARVLLVVD